MFLLHFFNFRACAFSDCICGLSYNLIYSSKDFAYSKADFLQSTHLNVFFFIDLTSALLLNIFFYHFWSRFPIIEPDIIFLKFVLEQLDAIACSWKMHTDKPFLEPSKVSSSISVRNWYNLIVDSNLYSASLIHKHSLEFMYFLKGPFD